MDQCEGMTKSGRQGRQCKRNGNWVVWIERMLTGESFPGHFCKHHAEFMQNGDPQIWYSKDIEYPVMVVKRGE